MRKIWHVFVFILLFVWQLPQNLVAMAVLLFAKNVRKITYRHFCFAMVARLPRHASGGSLGSFVILSPGSAHDERTLRHELDGHTVDSKIWGPLYLLIVGLPSAVHFLWYVHGDAKKRSYDDFYTERWANRHAGL